MYLHLHLHPSCIHTTHTYVYINTYTHIHAYVADRPKKSAGTIKKQVHKSKQAKLGSSVILPKGRFREFAEDSRILSKAIDKSNEQKVAAKVLQGGGKIATKDILQRGKELNKEQRRSQVKKKLGRVEEKLKSLKEAADAKGLI